MVWNAEYKKSFLGPRSLDDFAKKGKIPISSFRAQREISEIIERFLVAVLLEMTEINFLRNHHLLKSGKNLLAKAWPPRLSSPQEGDNEKGINHRCGRLYWFVSV
jgi:hypothetical protein